MTEHLSTADKQVVKDEEKAEKDYQASLDKATTTKESKVASAKKVCEDKQLAVTKANELATKAHAELMEAQKALGVAEAAPLPVPPVAVVK